MILITGSESFIGKELIKQLINEKISFIGIDLIEKKNSNYDYRKIDINDKNLMIKIPEKITVIIHLAAISRDSDCEKNKSKCFETNIIGTLNIIDFAIKKNVNQLIFASTEWVYENFAKTFQTEEDEINILNHISTYAISKLICEVNLKLISNKLKGITILRFGIIYGLRKTNWSAVESIFNSIKNNNEIIVDSLKNARRFVHVTDICKGIIQSLGLNGFNIVNLTGNKLISIKSIIEESEKILNKKVKIYEKNPKSVNKRNPSNKKAKKIIKWEPKISLKEGLLTLNK